MQAVEIQYDTYLAGSFTEMRHIRSFGPWKVLAATHGPAPVLLLISDEARSATLCLYYTRDERDRDAA